MTFLKLPYLSKLFLGVFFLCSCSVKNESNSQILKIPLTSEVSTLDPANSYDEISNNIVYQVFEQLYEYHYLKRPYTLQPLLAEDFPKIENEGKRYVIKIKKGIQYHDDPAFHGQKRFVKAEDFICQIKRLSFAPIRSNGSWLFDGKIKGFSEFRDKVGSDFEKFKTESIEGLKALDDHTLVIELVSPFPQLVSTLAMSFVSPIPLEIYEAYKEELFQHPVGTGPFQLKSWERSLRIKLVRFKDYHMANYPSEGNDAAKNRGLLKDAGKRLPFLNEVHFPIIKETQTLWLNFDAKKVDILKKVPKDNFSFAITNSGGPSDELIKKGISLIVSPTLTSYWFSFNMNHKILGKNKNLRLAIAHAIDVESFIKLFFNQKAKKANSIYPPDIFGYSPDQKIPYRYDLNLAKTYLAKAGYPGGKGLPTLVFDLRGANSDLRQQGDFIRKELEKIGLSVDISLNPYTRFLEKAKLGDLQFWHDGWTLDYPDAENLLQLLLKKNFSPGPNVSHFSNQRFEEIFEKFKILSDGEEKRSLMKEMEKIVFEELPWITGYYNQDYVLFYGHVKNYWPSDVIFNYLKYVRINEF